MIWIRLFFFALSFSFSDACSPVLKPAPDPAHSTPQKPDSTLVAFYNVENLFDTIDDPNIIDEEFLPGSDLRWNARTYGVKLFNVAKVLSEIGGGDGPDIFGLAEVENRKVIADLIQQAPLAGRRYKIVHEDSPDERGIDVGLVYDSGIWKYRSHEAIRLTLPGDAGPTRLILWTVLQSRGETLHVIVNHWPSRREGQQESEPRRLEAASQAFMLMTRIRLKEPDAHILVMGDFNDDPSDKSIREGLRARYQPDNLGPEDLFNPMAALHDPDTQGSLTYEGKWNLFDQIMVSKSLLGGAGWRYVPGSEGVFDPEFMQVGGNGQAKDAPRRSVFRGKFREDGFSDHFPVYLNLVWKGN
jgi:endonuclease/exonuclease/phosphatase family metal-dependent hydrolase